MSEVSEYPHRRNLDLRACGGQFPADFGTQLLLHKDSPEDAVWRVREDAQVSELVQGGFAIFDRSNMRPVGGVD